MNKRELAQRLAKKSHTSQAKAADEVDSLVYGLLKDMKQTAKDTESQAASGAPKPPAITPDADPKAPAKGKK